MILILPSAVQVLMGNREKQICQRQQARQELLAKEVAMAGEDRGQQGKLMVTREAIHRQDNRVMLMVQEGMAVMEVMEVKGGELTYPLQGNLPEMEEGGAMEETAAMQLPQLWAAPVAMVAMVAMVVVAVGHLWLRQWRVVGGMAGTEAMEVMVPMVRMGPVAKTGLREEMVLI
ncbi:TPA: hypothetical protein JEL57_004159 [Salmonella enterica subsp. enterica serovar Casablanca]|nr:hypothetical protein [Salmonella enterica subsp. enterica serovar Casablanca]